MNYPITIRNPYSVIRNRFTDYGIRFTDYQRSYE